MKTISYEVFEAVELRSGTVVAVENFPEARSPAYKIWVDFGADVGVLQTSARVTKHYTPETLKGRQLVGCVNLGTKRIAGFESQFLAVGFDDGQEGVSLVTIDPAVPNGQKLF